MQSSSVSKLFVLTLLCALILLVRLFWAYISAIVLALLIASAFYPLYSYVRRILKGKEHSASLIMSLFILLVLIIPMGAFVGTLSNEAMKFYDRTRSSVSLIKIQQAIQGDSVWAGRLRRAARLANIELTPENIQELATALGKNVGLFLSRQLSSFASNLMSFLVNFFVMMLVIYYIFRDGVRLSNYISGLLPFPPGQQELVVHKFREMGRAIFWGNGVAGFIQGVFGGIGFLIFGLESPVLWGTVIGFAAFLPVLGASAVFVPATAIFLVHGQTGLAVVYLAYNTLYTSIVEYIVKPRLIGKGMRMNPVLVFIGVLGGIKIFGILGIIYSPLIMTIFFTLAEIYKLEYKDAT